MIYFILLFNVFLLEIVNELSQNLIDTIFSGFHEVGVYITKTSNLHRNRSLSASLNQPKENSILYYKNVYIVINQYFLLTNYFLFQDEIKENTKF